MDSKIVNKSIRQEIVPLLKKNNFTEFNSRNALRFSEQKVDTINFQSFNSYLAEGVGCTTYSFAINLWVYYKFFEKTPWFNGKIPSKPTEYIYQEHTRLKKTLKQAKLFHPYNNSSSFGWEKDRDDIWYVKEDGSNLDEVIKDAKECISNEGLKYFERMKNLPEIIAYYENDAKKRGMSWIAADRISTFALQSGDIQKGINSYKIIMDKPESLKYHELRLEEIKKKRKRPIYTTDHWQMAKDRIDLLEKLK